MIRCIIAITLSITSFAAVTAIYGADVPMTFTQVDKNGATSCRRPHNAGVYANGRTFICWAGPKMTPCVKMYDHKKKEWSETVVVHSYRQSDYHDYPTIVLGGDNHLYMFWTRHNYEIYCARSPRPLDIRGEWTHTVTEKRVKATYPCPMTADNGDIYLFYRGRGNAKVSFADYVKSTDNGKTWQVTGNVINTGWKNGACGFYLQHVAEEPRREDRPKSYLLSWSLRSFRPRSMNNVYVVRFLPDTGQFESIDGTDLGDKISKQEATEHCMVKEYDQLKFWRLAQSQTNGHVLVCYGYQDTNETFCARWTGDKWKETELDFMPKEIEYLGNNVMRLYVTAKDRLDWWETKDSGKTWKKTGSLSVPIKAHQVTVIDNGAPDVRLFLKEDEDYDHNDYSGTDKILVVGDKDVETK